MCQIIVADSRVTIPEGLLLSESRTNKDGWGVMGLNKKGTRMNVVKGMDHGKLPEVVERFGEGRPRAVHVRYATQGKVNLDNCHPFDLWPKERPGQVALMHNGVLNGSKWDDETGEKSDTAMFVQWLGQMTSDMELDKAVNFLVDVIPIVDSYSRYLVLTSQGQILRFGKWHWQAEYQVWTSTDIWNRYVKYYGGWDGDDYDTRYGASCGYSVGDRGEYKGTAGTTGARAETTAEFNARIAAAKEQRLLREATVLAGTEGRTGFGETATQGTYSRAKLEDHPFFKAERLARWVRITDGRSKLKLAGDNVAYSKCFQGDYDQWCREVWDPLFVDGLDKGKWTDLRHWAEDLMTKSPQLGFEEWYAAREARRQDNRELMAEWKAHRDGGRVLGLMEYKKVRTLRKVQDKITAALETPGMVTESLEELAGMSAKAKQELEDELKRKFGLGSKVTIGENGEVEVSLERAALKVVPGDVEELAEEGVGSEVPTLEFQKPTEEQIAAVRAGADADDVVERGGYETAPIDPWEGDEATGKTTSSGAEAYEARMAWVGNEAHNYMTQRMGYHDSAIEMNFDNTQDSMDWLIGEQRPSIEELCEWVVKCPTEIVQLLWVVRSELRELYGLDQAEEAESDDERGGVVIEFAQESDSVEEDERDGC